MFNVPIILDSIAAMREFRKALGARSIGLVPTMGALHEGHASLFREARKHVDVVVGTVFVNPAQFAPQEDLSRYPRTWDADLRLMASESVDAVFVPTVAQMYPEGFSTWVEEQSMSQGLCGEVRPGHFRGVATVVLKLLNLAQPHKAWFGLKDLQQFWVISKMVRDLNLNVEVLGAETVRESDGLAMSSRNVYLSSEERARAPELNQTLERLATQLREGKQWEQLRALAMDQMHQHGWRVQYLDLRQFGGASYVLAAAWLGQTRLIDNRKV